MNFQKYRLNWLKSHKSYEKRALKILRRSFVKMANNIPFDELTKDNYRLIIELSVSGSILTDGYFDIYRQIGTIHGKKVGKGINKELKNFDPSIFESELQRNLYNWLIENVGSRITSVRKEYIKYINDLIVKGISENKTISEITTEIKKLIRRRSFYRWQSLRIARTETTTAANRGAIISGDISGVLMSKVWVSATDARTRRIPKDRFDHYIMNGVSVDAQEKFKVPTLGGFELINYPGAPNSSAGNIINCRCTVGFRPKRDANGRLIRTKKNTYITQFTQPDGKLMSGRVDAYSYSEAVKMVDSYVEVLGKLINSYEYSNFK